MNKQFCLLLKNILNFVLYFSENGNKKWHDSGNLFKWFN